MIDLVSKWKWFLFYFDNWMISPFKYSYAMVIYLQLKKKNNNKITEIKTL